MFPSVFIQGSREVGEEADASKGRVGFLMTTSTTVEDFAGGWFAVRTSLLAVGQ